MDSYLKLSSSKGKRPEDLERFMECSFNIPDSDIADNIITQPDFSTSDNTFSNPSPGSKKSNFESECDENKIVNGLLRTILKHEEKVKILEYVLKDLSCEKKKLKDFVDKYKRDVEGFASCIEKLKESISIKDNELKPLKLIHKNNTVSLCKQHKKEKAKLFSEIDMLNLKLKNFKEEMAVLNAPNPIYKLD